MPVVSSLDHLPTDGEFYSNNCVDGHCIGCGECCTDLLPTTRREIVRLRDYAKKHQLKEHRLPAALRRPWAESPPGAHQPAWPGGGLAPRGLRQAGRGHQERRKLYVHRQSAGQVRKGHSRQSLLLLPHRERRQGSRYDGGRQLGRWRPRAYRLAGKVTFPQPGRNADHHDDAGGGSELPHPAGRLRSCTGRPLEPILAAHDMPALG